MNAFYCRKCGKYTKQVQLSGREINAVDRTAGVIGDMLSVFNDTIGMTKLISTVFDERWFKCCECGKITTRKSSGEAIREWN